MKSTLLSVLLAASLFITSSCKEEDAANCAADYAAAYSAATTTLTTAITTYNNSAQTAADCTALKAGWQVYIDALKDFDNCSSFTAQQQADLDQVILQAEASRDAAC